MARSAKKDRVLPHLLRAQNAVRREEDAYLGRLLEKAIVHRAARRFSSPDFESSGGRARTRRGFAAAAGRR